MRIKKGLCSLLALGMLAGCSDASVPDARNVNIPAPVSAEKRREAVNERPDSVMYLPLGEDVLVPERVVGSPLPNDPVGPFELRGETLAGALQLILSDYDVSIAFESEQGLTRQVTVANLKGGLNSVVSRVCSLADLYCSYEDGGIIVKDTQTFTVSLPPLGGAEGSEEFITNVITGLTAILGESAAAPVSDPSTRTIIYSASQRTSKLAESYFERLRANTAMIVFETYIWEVSLNSGSSAGIDWSGLESFGKFNTELSVNGGISADFTDPISIGLPTTGSVNPTELFQFLAQFGAVKTISQPQITVLSGSSAELRVADTENYVSEITSTVSGDQTATSVSTDTVESGFTLNIGSSWDKSTVYADVNIDLSNVDDIEDFTFSGSGSDTDSSNTRIQLPQTTERELTTQIRVRPGDSVLIAGLVRERDNFDSRGPGFMKPIIPDSRTTQVDNLELVMLLRPRVIVYTPNDGKRNYQRFSENEMFENQEAESQAQVMTNQDSAVVLSEGEKSFFMERIAETQVVDRAQVGTSQLTAIQVEALQAVNVPQESKVLPLDSAPLSMAEANTVVKFAQSQEPKYLFPPELTALEQEPVQKQPLPQGGGQVVASLEYPFDISPAAGGYASAELPEENAAFVQQSLLESEELKMAAIMPVRKKMIKRPVQLNVGMPAYLPSGAVAVVTEDSYISLPVNDFSYSDNPFVNKDKEYVPDFLANRIVSRGGMSVFSRGVQEPSSVVTANSFKPLPWHR
jgi:hypothetical protein